MSRLDYGCGLERDRSPLGVFSCFGCDEWRGAFDLAAAMGGVDSDGECGEADGRLQG